MRTRGSWEKEECRQLTGQVLLSITFSKERAGVIVTEGLLLARPEYTERAPREDPELEVGRLTILI
jgi:hypothetical protein